MFVPTLCRAGVAGAMFLPLSLAVGFSRIASYVLSTTLVPILSVWFLRGHEEAAKERLEGRFRKFQKRYAGMLQRVVRLRWLVFGVYLVVAALVIALVGRQLGTDIFPSVLVGRIQRLRSASKG